LDLLIFFFGKAFRLKPEYMHVNDFASYKHHVNSMAGEQCGKDELTARAVTKSREPGIFPGYYKSGPRLLKYKTKILQREKCIELQNYELIKKPIAY